MATESWVFEDPDWVRRGYGATFAVRECGTCLWEISGSPFLLDLQKRFNSLEEAQQYCEERWAELFGHREEIAVLRGQVEALDNERNRLWAEKLIAQGKITSLREETARLREALTPFVDARHFGVFITTATTEEECLVSIYVKERDFRAASAAIREGEKGDGKNN